MRAREQGGRTEGRPRTFRCSTGARGHRPSLSVRYRVLCILRVHARARSRLSLPRCGRVCALSTNVCCQTNDSASVYVCARMQSYVVVVDGAAKKRHTQDILFTHQQTRIHTCAIYVNVHIHSLCSNDDGAPRNDATLACVRQRTIETRTHYAPYIIASPCVVIE